MIAGPIYDEDFGSIGPNADIKILSKDFKVLFILEANQTIKDINAKTPMISVIMPNRLQDGSRSLANTAGCCGFLAAGSVHSLGWEKYQTSLDEIERLSGLTFFPM